MTHLGYSKNIVETINAGRDAAIVIHSSVNVEHDYRHQELDGSPHTQQNEQQGNGQELVLNLAQLGGDQVAVTGYQGLRLFLQELETTFA